MIGDGSVASAVADPKTQGIPSKLFIYLMFKVS